MINTDNYTRRDFLKAMSLGATALTMPGVFHTSENTKRVWKIAKSHNRPLYGPKASDVIMRSLRLHPRNKNDPHDTMQALKDFHVTRLEWAYITKKDFIDKVKASGRIFGGAASAPSYLHPEDSDWYDKVVIRNANGEPIIAPWKRSWNRTLWGCVNNSEYERGYIEYLKRYIDAGAQVMQRDEPRANYLATRWGGCFCTHCMKAFRQYLRENTTQEKRRELDITELKTFNYAKHVKNQGAPVGDEFGRWKGDKLKELFVDFQMQSSIAFHKRTRQAIDEYAGRHILFSCNNGARRWGEIELMFDWFFGELSYSHAKPDYLYNIMRQAANYERLQVVTMPKKGDRKNMKEWECSIRQTIATAYACGGLCMVPWDVYMPKNAPRYFGTPQQYADLFGFVRANTKLLEGYEDAAVAGKNMKECRYSEPPVLLSGGSGDVRAFVRARPGQAEAPVVIHLVEWSNKPKPFTLRLRKANFFGENSPVVNLLVPTKYSKDTHKKAETQNDFSELSKTIDIKSTTEDEFIFVQIHALNPWGMLLVSPEK